MRKKSIVIIILSLLLTSCDSGYGIWIRSITNETTIKTSENEQIIPYEKLFYLDYYIKDDVSDQSKIRNILTTNLNKIFPLIDNDHYYLAEDEFINNLKVINESINQEEIVVDPTLFTLLKMGKQQSILDPTYSLFMGNLNIYWTDLISQYNETNATQNDPYFDDQAREELETILTCLPKTQVEIDAMLELNEETNGVRFLVDESCQSLKNRPLIDLKDLSIAYLVDVIKAELLEYNFNQGLIYANGNMVYTLGDAIDKWSFALRDPRYPPNKDIKTMVSVVTNKSYGAYTIDNFSLNKSYLIKDTQQEFRRHDKINAITGYPNNNVVSIIGVTTDQSAIDLYFQTQKLFNSDNENSLKQNLTNLFDVIYVVKNDEQYNIYSTSTFDNKISAKADFELIILE